jgi:tetratricopeptide (TPR) repeat protein
VTIPAVQIMERSTDVVEWALHLCRVGLWVLLAGWLFITAVRLGVLAARRQDPRLLGLGPPHPVLAAVLSVLGGLGASGMAIRPDERFLVNRGGLAAQRYDCAAAIRYLEPVADWNTSRPEVYENLGMCYLVGRRFRDAVGAFHRARALSPTVEAYAYCALAHVELGESEEARRDLEQALPLARTEKEKAEFARRLEALGGPLPRAATR